MNEREQDILDLKSRLKDAENFKYNNQVLHNAYVHDLKITICKQDEELRNMDDALRQKQSQFELFQREFELNAAPKIEERIKHEKTIWEQEQNTLIRKELNKLGEEKSKELERQLHELNSIKDKLMLERERNAKLEKQIDELNHEQKMLVKEKSMAISKARESFRSEIDKIKADALEEKQEEINKYKRLLKETEEENDRFKVEAYKFNDKEKEFILAVEKLEKSLIKELNEEQRKMSTLVPGLLPKLVNSSNIRSGFTVKSLDAALSLNTFHVALNNLKGFLEELAQNFQNLKADNEQAKRTINKIVQEKEESIESIKRQYERQKQKELETIREYITKDQDTLNNYTNEVSSLVAALKNKDREIQDIQENMVGWKKETLTKLAEKFEIELNKELDKRMSNYKIESSNLQAQLDKIRKEMDCLVKEYRQSSNNQVSQDQHDRMVRYLQSRLNDLRDENLSLRERLKPNNYLQQHQHHNGHQPSSSLLPTVSSSLQAQHQLNNTKTYSDNEFVNMNASICSGTYMNIPEARLTNIHNHNNNINTNNNIAPSLPDDDCGSNSLYTQSLDGDDRLESRNELLQQKLEELQKLQIQLNNVQS